MRTLLPKAPRRLLSLLAASNLLVVALTITALAVLFWVSWRADFKRQQLLRAETMTAFLAKQSEFSLLVGNRSDLEHIAASGLADEDVLWVRITDRLNSADVTGKRANVQNAVCRPNQCLEVTREVKAAPRNDLVDWDSGPHGEPALLGRVSIGVSLEKQQAILRRTALESAFGVVLALGIIAGLQYVQLRKLLRPLRDLIAFTRRIGGGELGHRAEVDHVEEFADVAVAFNQMLDRLSQTTVSRDYVDNIISSMAESLIVIDSERKIRSANQATAELLGISGKDLAGRDALDLLESGSPDPFKQQLGVERTYRANDSRLIPVLFSSAALRDKDGETTGYVWLAQDITEQKRVQHELMAAEERYELAVAGARDGIWDWDLQNGLYFSPRWKAMLGCEEQELADTLECWMNLIHPDDRRRVAEELNAHRVGVAPVFESEHRMMHRDGSYRWMLSRGLAVRGPDGTATRIAGSQTDITQNKVCDPLTGLPNRVLFTDLLNAAFERRRRSPDYLFAVLFLDVDRFKMINDSMGHLAGDQLLRGISHRLQETLPSRSHGFNGEELHIIARLSGDEFAILIENPPNLERVYRAGEELIESLSRPFLIDGREVFTSASIGVAPCTADYAHPADILRDADTAMYRAKALGKSRCEVFDGDMRAQAVRRLEMDTDLRKAIERDEFRVYYQPTVHMDDRRLHGFEALVRWQHPEKGLIPPGQFIPLAEETGLILPIGIMVLRQACRQMQLWKQQYESMSDLDLSVNLSTRQLLDPSLASQLAQILEETGLDAGNLHLELTESVLMEDAESCVRVLSCLKELGVGLKIDDFGTGYSSLSYLHRLPIDTLKIDRAFIVNMEKDESLTIIKAIIALAGNLNMQIVAEGVETAKHLFELRQLGCQYGQGYYFSQPLPALAAGKLIEEAARKRGPQVLNVQQNLVSLQERMRQLPDSDVPDCKSPEKAVLSAA